MSETSGLLWVKLLGLLIAAVAFFVWQWRDLRDASRQSAKGPTNTPLDPKD
jgi:hypothetical protein